ncbi:DUF1048 domain-containing protein [Agrococcus sp. TF02-05]|uniref:DUF1048 domain-containing protein n=1 Tax=Agrococcus sp. TF02-05 TaxID=2815211 RepID=UPI001AA18E85|nr:DUF1048 domain-containing protein [Agrococcus sp. TF02-05]MBO1769906.1 DUF1048 domain-containing protein [Agrococcus sp. TF02-05]
MSLSDFAAKVVGEKKRWRAYKARVKQLPDPYRATVEAIERYLLHSGATPVDGDRAADMFEDLADLFERAAADGKPIRDIVGEQPIEFVDDFVRTYADSSWIAKERARLTEAIERAAGES